MSKQYRHRLVALVAAGTVLGTVISGSATHAGAPQPAQAVRASNVPLSVPDEILKVIAGSQASLALTLITGDIVHIGLDEAGRPVVRDIEPAKRTGAGAVFHTVTRQGNLHVIPSDALALIDSGLLDWSLFDIVRLARLAAAGKLKQVPVLVSYTDKTALQRAPRTVGASAVRNLHSINGGAYKIDHNGQWWREVRASGNSASPESARSTGPLTGIRKIWLNGLSSVALEDSVPQVGAPVAWARGHDGSGVTVAVLDTGIDASHPDVAGRITGTADFTGTTPNARDGHGHGTHVASTIAGTGAASNGLRKGVAPGANLLIGKICDDGGSCTDDAVIAGMEWAATSEAKVISMSIGGPATDGTDPLSMALNSLSLATGRLFVVAAGNSGPGAQTVGTPGAADEALTVAAVDKADQMASFSSRGPRKDDLAAKPDIAAPGVDIVAARAQGTSMGTVVNDRYTTASGTSMATPHVSGVAALVASRHPELSGQQLKSLLMSSSVDLGHDLYSQGAGRVSAAQAIDPTLTATGSLNFGRSVFPHSAATRTHTYTNHTDEPITLKLSVSVASGGQTPPAGLLRLSAAQVVVPAHGSADVTVTVDGTVLGQTGPFGRYQGILEAHDTTGTLRASSRIMSFLEPQRHELTVKIVPPAGAAEFEISGALLIPVDDKVNLHDSGATAMEFEGNLVRTSPFVDGTYAMQAVVNWRDAAGRLHHAVPMVEQITLTGPATVTVDLNKAKPVRPQGLPEGSENYDTTIRWDRTSVTDTWSLGGQARLGYGAYDVTLWAVPTRAVTMGTFSFRTSGSMVTPSVTMTAKGGGAPIDLGARYSTPDASVKTRQSWETPEARLGRSAFIPVPHLPTNGKLSVVHAGSGTAAELAKVKARGKLVLIRPLDICTRIEGCQFPQLQQRVADAAQAGAVGVLVAGPAGMGKLGTLPATDALCPDGPESCPAPQQYAALPIVTVAADAAEKLISRLGRNHVEIHLGGSADPESYLFAFDSDRRVPDLPYRVTPRDFDRVEHRVHSSRPGENFGLVWWRFSASQREPIAATTPATAMQKVITTYTQRQSNTIDRFGLEWEDYSGTLLGGPTRGEQLEVVAGATKAVLWNKGPTVPGALTTVRTPSGFAATPLLPCAGCRQGNMFFPSLYVTSSSGARQALTGVYDRPFDGVSLFELFFGIQACENGKCEFGLYDSAGQELERRTLSFQFIIGPGGTVTRKGTRS